MPRGRKKNSTARKNSTAEKPAEAYRHHDAESLMRPEVGTQAKFRKRKPPETYRYDSSLSPALDWDPKNSAREEGEAAIRQILDAKSLDEAKAAAHKLKSLSKPFLNWAGKAERFSFDVPTLPLFVHERLSTKAIIETLKSHRKEKDQQLGLFELFGDPQRSIADQVLRAYEYKDKWVNRMVLGDSLVVMNSLLHYEGLGGQVQMIYMDPPYGVKFGSNFQPFVRRRDVSHGDDDDLTREPEMVQAYRDTWELGLHSYLTYMRDRLLLCHALLASTGSVFVQISDENLHHVRELMDEVFGDKNRLAIINFVKTAGLQSADDLTDTCDYLLWYAKDRERVKYNPLYVPRELDRSSGAQYSWLELADGTRRRMNANEADGSEPLPSGAKRYRVDNLTKPGPGSRYVFEFEGKKYEPGRRWWGMPPESMRVLAKKRRLQASGQTLYYVRYWADFPFRPISNLWTDTAAGGFAEERLYVVQTGTKVVERCLMLATDPGDIVLDPTCGSGTTAYVSERWGRRWITVDTSRVPLALARQRLLTATFPWYELQDESRGPGGGLRYRPATESVNPKSVGPGVVEHVTSSSLANNEPPAQEILVDRPEVDLKIVRVSGPFAVEATIPTPVEWMADELQPDHVGEVQADYGPFVDRMLEVLRRSPVLRLGNGKTVTFRNVRPPAKTLSLSVEAEVANGKENPVAIVFGPENAAVSERLVYEAAKEASAKKYHHLYVIGFAIQPNARELIEKCEEVAGIPATYVQATPDLLMGDLLKNMRSSQIFSVCGLPEIEIKKVKPGNNGEAKYQVVLAGLDVFDPIEMKNEHKSGADVPAWFLDADYNGMCFHVSQAFFPRTGAWEHLKKALTATHDESVWDHLAGTESAPFEAGDHKQVAVKVIDDRGNELLVVESLSKAKS